jgi:hypothetical protein
VGDCGGGGGDASTTSTAGDCGNGGGGKGVDGADGGGDISTTTGGASSTHSSVVVRMRKSVPHKNGPTNRIVSILDAPNMFLTSASQKHRSLFAVCIKLQHVCEIVLC